MYGWPMNELINTLQEIPPAALVPLVAALVIGVLLWAAGRRVLRTGFAGLGLLGGFVIGWLVGEWQNFGIPAWAVGLIFGVVLAVVAVILYRTAIAATMAILLAVASPMAVVAMHEWQGRTVFVEVAEDGAVEDEPEEPEVPESDEFDEWLDEQRDELVREQVDGFVPQEYAEQIEQIRSFGERLVASLRETWAQIAEPVRPTLIGAAISGAILGLILGGLLPGVSAAVITAFGGSILWLTSLRVLVERVGWGDLGFLPTTGRGWLIMWLIASAIGLAIQWTLGAKKADK